MFNAYKSGRIWKVQIKKGMGQGDNHLWRVNTMRKGTSILGTIMYQKFFVSISKIEV